MQAAYGKFESKGTFRRFCFAFFCLVFAFLCAGASALRHEENVFVLLVWSFFCVCFLRFSASTAACMISPTGTPDNQTQTLI